MLPDQTPIANESILISGKGKPLTGGYEDVPYQYELYQRIVESGTNGITTNVSVTLYPPSTASVLRYRYTNMIQILGVASFDAIVFHDSVMDLSFYAPKATSPSFKEI